MTKAVHVTKEGLEKLRKELEYLKGVKRPEVSKKIEVAREFGDLKENAEYHAAKEELGLLETKIAQLNEKIARARIIDHTDLPEDQVTIFTKVKLKDLDKNTEIEWTIVPQDEADLEERKLPVNSPIAKGLLGKRLEDEVEVVIPRGKSRYKVLAMEKVIL